MAFGFGFGFLFPNQPKGAGSLPPFVPPAPRTFAILFTSNDDDAITDGRGNTIDFRRR